MMWMMHLYLNQKMMLMMMICKITEPAKIKYSLLLHIMYMSFVNIKVPYATRDSSDIDTFVYPALTSAYVIAALSALDQQLGFWFQII